MIVLVRHGATEGGAGRCIGRTQLRLSAEGLSQASQLAEAVSATGFARLCSSPSGRALDTVAPLSARLSLEPEILPGLDEIDMGEWDGVPFEDIKRMFPAQYAERGTRFGDFRPPGGESFHDVADRAMTALEALAHGPMPVLAATHAGVIRSVLCRLTDHPMDDLFFFSPGQLRCTVLSLAAGGFRGSATGVAPHDLSRDLV